MKIEFKENKYSCYALVVAEDKETKQNLNEVCSLFSEFVQDSFYDNMVRINLNSEQEYKEIEKKFTFARDNYARIVSGINSTEYVFTDYYNNPDLLPNATSKAKLDCNKRYLATKSEIKLRMSPDVKEEIQKRATSLDKSVNAYIMDLIRQDMERIEREREEEEFEVWKDMRQHEDDNGLDEPIAHTGLDVDVRDCDNIEDAIFEASKLYKDAFNIK